MSERLLSQPFDLTFPATGEVVRDVEAIARGAMGAERWPLSLEPCDNDELLAFLLSEALLVLADRYDPAGANERLGHDPNRTGSTARAWLFGRFRFKARDWRDSWERHRTLPELPTLDDDEQGDFDRRAGVGSGSHGAPGEVSGDRGDPGTDALEWLLESGDRALLREIEALGLSAPPGARGHSPDAQRRLDRLDRQRKKRVRELKLRDRNADQVAA